MAPGDERSNHDYQLSAMTAGSIVDTNRTDTLGNLHSLGMVFNELLNAAARWESDDPRRSAVAAYASRLSALTSIETPPEGVS